MPARGSAGTNHRAFRRDRWPQRRHHATDAVVATNTAGTSAGRSRDPRSAITSSIALEGLAPPAMPHRCNLPSSSWSPCPLRLGFDEQASLRKSDRGEASRARGNGRMTPRNNGCQSGAIVDDRRSEELFEVTTDRPSVGASGVPPARAYTSHASIVAGDHHCTIRSSGAIACAVIVYSRPSRRCRFPDPPNDVGTRTISTLRPCATTPTFAQFLGRRFAHRQARVVANRHAPPTRRRAPDESASTAMSSSQRRLSSSAPGRARQSDGLLFGRHADGLRGRLRLRRSMHGGRVPRCHANRQRSGDGRRGSAAGAWCAA